MKINEIESTSNLLLCGKLEVFLKNESLNLNYLTLKFSEVSESALAEYISKKPLGKYTRRLWFLFEFITGKRLPLDDITSGNYIPFLDETKYISLNKGTKSQRHRVINNLLGPSQFCPVIVKTSTLQQLKSYNLRSKAETLLKQYPPELFRRMVNYLYTKETKSSFAIEKEHPNSSRIDRFIAALELAEHEDFCNKDRLIELKNRIVDTRFQDTDYRNTQNYVGQTLSFQNEIIHYICPKPQDLPELMGGLLRCHTMMAGGNIHPIIHAAVIAYGFVFLHPFEDGNGRIHRFLIHNILSLEGAVPPGLMFPVSAVMLKNPVLYDDSLESFSNPLLSRITYSLSDTGVMRVENDTKSWYRFMDLTNQVEAVFTFIKKTIDEEIVSEFEFLQKYEKTKSELQEIVDMPDRLIDLFIHCCLQNKGTLSSTKRTSHFDFLTDTELTLMEQAVRSIFF